MPREPLFAKPGTAGDVNHAAGRKNVMFEERRGRRKSSAECHPTVRVGGDGRAQ
jgi:hypothetical protein